MKNIGLTVLVSVLSSVLAIMIYDHLKGGSASVVTIRETMPVRYTSYSADAENPNRQLYYSAAPTNFTQAAEIVRPTVVNIRALQNSKKAGTFDEIWGGLTPGTSTGSGVIVSKDGYIVTNFHVIEGANTIEVTLHNKRTYDAKVVGTDASTDLALLKINKEDLVYLPFGNSDSARIGEWVLAVGNPFNLTSTVTAGIVSAKGRNINILEGNYKIESFIQTDAAVNPGNSGGALVNTNGELIGINTAIITQSGRYEGYSFAVPANLVRKVVDDLKEFGVVQRGFLGVTIEDVSEEVARKTGLKKLEGVHITQISPNSAASDANLEKGDIITHINRVKVETMPELQEQVALYRPGDEILIEYLREGKKKSTKLILKDKYNHTKLVGKNTVKGTELLDELGFQLRETDEEERSNLRIKNGVKVLSVRKGSTIERTNLTPGFVITKVNDTTVDSVQDVISQIERAHKKVILEGVYENFPDEYYYTFAK